MSTIFSIEIDESQFFLAALNTINIITNNLTFVVRKDKLLLNESSEMDGSQYNVNFMIRIDANKVENYYFNDNETDSNFFTETLFGVKCKDLIRGISKIGKKKNIILSLEDNDDEIELGIKIPYGIGKFHRKRISVNENISEINGKINYYKKKRNYIIVDTKKFRDVLAGIKSCKCDNILLTYEGTFFTMNGRILNKIQTDDEFGRNNTTNKKSNFLLPSDTNKKLKYIIKTSGINILTKLSTTTDIKIKFFFFKNKLVIKSNLQSNGKTILTFDFYE